MVRTRSPRYSRFLIAGAAVGVVVGFVLAEARHTAATSPGVAVVYTAGFAGAIGAILFGLLAVLLDRPDPGGPHRPDRAGPDRPDQADAPGRTDDPAQREADAP
ncbi:hypothetical protein EV189_0767 [Motilibacter rhizosphaerae]|uniref:Uncharacterized protein n=1 Tax=Motilibacter rhizosphaerae TaxID=598652 RepID=A0A4Q7NWD7_9ACTN|nr:hypothetical protein [Motilibacter rhizosphaerae]RZS91525.1 hypothetical protein EV189_0767 [Motilibacter rhizosphaerae]